MNYKLLLAVQLIALALNTTAGNVNAGNNAVGKSDGKQMTVEEVLAKLSENTNKQLPRTIDRNTRVDTTEVAPGRRMTYHYTITNARADDVDVEKFYQSQSPNLRNSVCTDPAMQVFLKNGVTFSYSYRGIDGSYITKIEITPSDCGIPAAKR